MHVSLWHSLGQCLRRRAWGLTNVNLGAGLAALTFVKLAQIVFGTDHVERGRAGGSQSHEGGKVGGGEVHLDGDGVERLVRRDGDDLSNSCGNSALFIHFLLLPLTTMPGIKKDETE